MTGINSIFLNTLYKAVILNCNYISQHYFLLYSFFFISNKYSLGESSFINTEKSYRPQNLEEKCEFLD